MLTHSELIELLHYDQDTGIFTRKAKHYSKSAFKIGDIAGSLTNKGYVVIMVKAKKYSAHRLVWLYVYGKFPSMDIDHKNGIRNDNRLCNLREASSSQNSMNYGVPSNNTTGFKGVSFFKRTGRWKASAKLNGHPYHLGYFSSPELASAAYEIFTAEHHKEFKFSGVRHG